MAAKSPQTVEEFLKPYPLRIQRLSQCLCALIKNTVPDLVEIVYGGWRLIGYRVIERKKSHYFCYVAPFEDHVQLGFEYGTLLSDPNHLLTGKGTQVRQVVIRRAHDISTEKLSMLIAEAAMVALDRKKYPAR
ncbi:MAG: DUF1801 domain-containing protein [Ignavibacteria bacterium]|nr:DUF1801 domain-containing protein [Ignavibacteria bacterium]